MKHVAFAVPFVGLLAAALTFGACGGSTNNPPPPSGDAGGGDASPAPDGGSLPDAFHPPGYPAAHNPIPQMVNTNGPILTAPVIVTVTFPNDAMRPTLEAFGAALTLSNWWNAVGAEYGVGQGTALNAHISAAPDGSYAETTRDPTVTSGIRTFIQDHVTNGELPAPTTQTLYVLYFPASTTVTIDGQSTTCKGVGGYHFFAQLTPPGGGAKVNTAYAVVPRCADPATNQITESAIEGYASHEIIEAATNVTPSPPMFSRGWAMDPTSAWGVILPESADLCHNDELGIQIATRTELYTDLIQENGFTYQRGWSNRNVQAGLNPCVPIPAGDVYFNSAPKQDVLSVAVGATTTVEVDAFSEAPMLPWTLQAVELNSLLLGQPDVLALSLDNQSVKNGDKATLSITMKSAPRAGASIVWLISKTTTAAHVWPIVVAQQ